MGVPREQAARNRQAILDTAIRVFRERGVDGVGVADLMKEAGFTHGGFYNHFKSKEALAAEACASAFAERAAKLKATVEADPARGAAALREFITAYLASSGCPSATLAMDAARQGREMQAAYAQGVETFLQAITAHYAAADRQASGRDNRGQAIEMLATLVGTITLARGVGAAEPALAAEILAAGRKHVPD
jgi:TetR/AcrR family transcriptional repressor of nem operon